MPRTCARSKVVCLDTTAAAEFLGVRVETVRQLAKEGFLVCFQMGKKHRLYFPLFGLNAWKAKNPVVRKECR
jgi:hypothetical protein